MNKTKKNIHEMIDRIEKQGVLEYTGKIYIPVS